MNLPKLKDQEIRDRIQYSLHENLLVEAAAGTGKTTALVSRLVSVFQKGNALPDQVVAVTFTRKAAGELRLRLREALDQQRLKVTEPDQKENLDRALGALEEAHIGTIHSFCAELLRERPVEALVDPGFRELAEDETNFLIDKLFRNWIQVQLSNPPEGLRRIFQRSQIRTGFQEENPIEKLKQTAAKILEWRDYPAAWRRPDFSRDRWIDQLVEETFGVTAMCGEGTNLESDLLKALQPLNELTTWITRAENEKPRDYDFLEGQLVELEKRLSKIRVKKSGKEFSEKFSRTRVLAARENLLASLASFSENADADLAALIQQEIHQFVAYFEVQKKNLALLDFNDLLLLAGRMLRENRHIRAYFQKRFSYVFVDEFQDTDTLQAEILLLLCSDDPDQANWRKVRPAPGKLFLVGDPKQSIYRFRRADVVLYQEIKEQLDQQDVKIVHLTQNFRSSWPILELVNACFSNEMTGDRRSGQAQYVPLDPVKEASTAHPSIVILPVPSPYGLRDVAKYAIRRSFPDAAASFIQWLISESNWTINDPVSGEKVPIAPRHIALLFRSFVSWGEDVTRDYTRGLEARGIVHLLVGSRTFHQREEVQALRIALSAVEWPEDELSVYALLRGSLFAFPDRTLFRYREKFGNLNPARSVRHRASDSELESVQDCLEFIAKLHGQRNNRPVVETLNELLTVTRAHAGFALRPAGNQVLANIQRVFDLARGLETQRNFSFRSFVEFLESENENPTANESPVFEEGIDGVRLMTVHGAKGLEFPVVLLADPVNPIAFSNPGRFTDHEELLAAFPILGCEPLELKENREIELEREHSEGVRIAYVAATRARDLLIIPGVGDSPVSGWLNPLNQGIYPAKKQWRNSQPAPGCPDFGSSSVTERSQQWDGCQDFSVRPGLHKVNADSYDFVWWDPSMLNLQVQANFGLRQEEILAEDSDETLQDTLRKYLDWNQKRSDRIQQGSKRKYQVTTVTELAKTASPSLAMEVTYEKLDSTGRKSSGERFGTLVHTLLRDIHWGADRSTVEKMSLLHGRLLAATEEEMKESVDTILRVLEHPLLKQAAESDECHRELPILMQLDSETMVEGTIDLLFREGESWVVVDYKTDADIGERLSLYEKQIQWYGLGLSRARRCNQIRGVLLGI